MRYARVPASPDTTAVALKLLEYCRANDWAGYDPYDALNSRLLQALPLLDARLPRLALTQILKRSPINIRPLVGIPKTQNPKGLALFLSALLRLPQAGTSRHGDLAGVLIDRLIALRSTGTPYWCWGYSFPWQTRTVVVPRGAPNLVCTSFVANALFDAYEHRGDLRCLSMAVSAAEYFAQELFWTEGSSVAGFSYPTPSIRVRIHNSNFLGAAVCCRAHAYTGERRLIDAALRVARYSATQQNEDGSWYYGEHSTQQWIDNFHTGFNLCALRAIARYARTSEFDSCIERGLEFYRRHFFRTDGAARYFHDRTYPIDIHSVAQGIITLLELRDRGHDHVALAKAIYRWAMDHMWDERGFFYYRVLRWGTIRTPFMRWSQAWMLLALATLAAATAAGESPIAADAGATHSSAAVA